MYSVRVLLLFIVFSALAKRSFADDKNIIRAGRQYDDNQLVKTWANDSAGNRVFERSLFPEDQSCYLVTGYWYNASNFLEREISINGGGIEIIEYLANAQGFRAQKMKYANDAFTKVKCNPGIYLSREQLLADSNVQNVLKKSTRYLSVMWHYDTQGHIIQETSANASGAVKLNFTQKFDTAGNLLRIKYNRSDDVLETYFTYDSINRCLTESDRIATATASVIDTRKSYVYDDSAGIKQATTFKSGLVFYRDDSTFKEGKLVLCQIYDRTNDMMERHVFSYNGNGDLEQVIYQSFVHGSKLTTRYEYDYY